MYLFHLLFTYLLNLLVGTRCPVFAFSSADWNNQENSKLVTKVSFPEFLEWFGAANNFELCHTGSSKFVFSIEVVHVALLHTALTGDHYFPLTSVRSNLHLYDRQVHLGGGQVMYPGMQTCLC